MSLLPEILGNAFTANYQSGLKANCLSEKNGSLVLPLLPSITSGITTDSQSNSHDYHTLESGKRGNGR